MPDAMQRQLLNSVYVFLLYRYTLFVQGFCNSQQMSDDIKRLIRGYEKDHSSGWWLKGKKTLSYLASGGLIS